MIGGASGHHLAKGNTDNERGATGMAICTVTVDVSELAFAILDPIISLMLVFVVTKMKRGRRRFVLTIGSRHRPG